MENDRSKFKSKFEKKGSNSNLNSIYIQHRLFITITLLKIYTLRILKDRIAYYVNRFYQM